MMLRFPIVDSHVHVLDPSVLSYPWLQTVTALNHSFLPERLFEESAPLQLDGIVVVQAETESSQSMEEVLWVSSLAAAEPRIAGIVAWACLEAGDRAHAELERLAAHRLVKGVRRIVPFEDDPHYFLRSDVRAGVRILSGLPLTCDLCADPRQLGEIATLVRACPEVRFVIDHVGAPDVRNGVREAWRAGMRELARHPNVHCKLSGLATRADPATWTTADVIPFLDTAISFFGFDRCMFGGDWPVALLATSYRRWVDTILEAVQGCTSSDLRKLFHTNARTFYRLGEVHR